MMMAPSLMSAHDSVALQRLAQVSERLNLPFGVVTETGTVPVPGGDRMWIRSAENETN
jgi:hypothetical protein